MPACHNCGALYNEGETVCSQCRTSLTNQALDNRLETCPFEWANCPLRGAIRSFKRIKCFLGSLWGILAGVSLVLPFWGRLTEVMEIPTDLKSISRVIALIACIFAILLSYTKRESLWKHELMRGVRGVRRISINIVAILFLLGALLLWAAELAVSRAYAEPEYPERRLLIPAIYCLALGGITASLSLLASLNCMKRLDEAKEYERPEYLRDETDLVKLVAPQIKEHLDIPAEESLKVVFRESTRTGGLRFTIRRREQVLTRNERGDLQTIEKEQEYQVEVDARGKLVSLKEKADKKM